MNDITNGEFVDLVCDGCDTGNEEGWELPVGVVWIGTVGVGGNEFSDVVVKEPGSDIGCVESSVENV